MEPNHPNRKPVRLKAYDYAQNGAYFVTVCTHERKPILSKIVGDGLHPVPQTELTTIGQEVGASIAYMNSRYGDIIEKYVIMPNHFHMIVLLQSGGQGNPPLQDVVGRIKSYTTKRYNEMMQTENETLWQRSFYDHIIRSEQEYNEVWRYVDENPFKWQEDRYYT
jgi:REP element-mobilizing transposase RayT